MLYDLVRSILMRAHVQNPCPTSATPALPQPGPPIPGPSQPVAYDPVVAQYEEAPPAYNPPPPWFAGMPTTATPSVSPGAQVAAQAEVQVVQDAVPYDGAAIDQELFNALMQAAAYSAAAQHSAPVAPDASPDPYAVPESAQPEPDPVAMANALFDYHMQVAEAVSEAPAQDQPDPAPPLEQMVEQVFQQMMDAGMLPPPEMMGPGMPMGPGMGPMM